MSYRSIKRVIGETSLERKCRFLFVACLTVLLTVTFWWVEHIAEDLVQGTAIRKSRDLVDAALLRYHWEQWEISDPNADPQHAKALREMARELARDLQTQKYKWDILALEETPNTSCPAAREEKAIMLQLKESLQDADAVAIASGRLLEMGRGAVWRRSLRRRTAVAPMPTTATSSPEILPVYRFPARPFGKRRSITTNRFTGRRAVPVAIWGLKASTRSPKPTCRLDRGKLPFRVVKVIIPDLRNAEGDHVESSPVGGHRDPDRVPGHGDLVRDHPLRGGQAPEASAGRERRNQSRQHGTAGRDRNQRRV